MTEPVPVVKRPFDLEAYAKRVHGGPCLVCEVVSGRPEQSGHVFYEDTDAIGFLTAYPTLLGHSLVAPKRHAKAAVDDLSLKEYVRLQRVVYRVAKAVAAVVPTERVYVLSLGSEQGNAHVHWHVAPLPPGVPYAQQQFHALMAENGVLEVSADQQNALAASIRSELGRQASGEFR